VLPPGLYRATLSVADLVGDAGGEMQIDTVHVRAYEQPGDTLLLSDLQLAYKIQFVGDTLASQKVKNGYYIEPNPGGLYAPEDSVIFFYGELYNLAPEPTSFRVRLWILNTAGDVVKQLPPRFAPRLGESALLTYGLGLGDLPVGARYQLAVEVDQGDRSVSGHKYFWLGHGAAGPPVASTDEPFTDEDAEFNEHFLAHITTAEEMREYRALNLDGKRRFLLDFWRRRDPDPSTPQNEFYQEHARRFAVANEKFSRALQHRNDGWNTDRGRVFILYGPPDDIIYSSSSIGSLPWERWEYRQLEGGVFFIFVDENNLGVYRLVHSNKQGEKQDPDWEERIQREGLDIINR
jgi:GWxTD domain-containing protein